MAVSAEAYACVETYSPRHVTLHRNHAIMPVITDRPLCGSAGELKLQFTVVAVWGSVLCDIGGIEVREQTGVTSYLLYM